METTLIFISYNSYQILADCLISAKKHGISEKNMLVVDNASTDMTIEKIGKEFSQVKTIALASNLGYGGAINQAIPQIKTRYVCVLNTDIVFISNPFYRLEKFYSRNKDSGIIGIQQIFPDKKWQLSFGKFISLSQILQDLLWISWLQKNHEKKLFDKGRNRIKNVEYIDGAFMFMEVAKLNKIGGFDNKNFFFYYEDNDIALRFVKGGFKNYFIPDLKIIHYRGYNTTKNFSIPSKFSLEQYSIGLINYLRKHYKKRYEIIYLFLLSIQCLKQILIGMICYALKSDKRCYFKIMRFKTILIDIFKNK